MKKQFTVFLILIFILGLVPINFSRAEDLSNKLSGKILLQVQDKGQAWYIDPGTKQRAFLGRPADAFQIMKELGLGISEKDYNSFNGYALASLSGRILLRVEANGEAYYVNPTDLKMYYLGRPADAFKVMREKGLGITDEDLTTVPIFQKYKEQTEANTNAINSLSQVVEEQQKKINELEGKINTNASTSTDSCTADTWSCGTWSDCSSGGQQTRACNLTFDCQNVNTPSPSTSQSCSYSSNNNCTSWTYSSWGICSTNGQQTRTVISSSPSGCTGGSPILNQSCVHTTLAITKYSGFGNQTIIPGTTDTPLGSFIVTSGASEGVLVNSVTVTLSSDNASYITALKLKDNATGVQVGTTKVSPNTSNVFSVSFNLAASQSKVIKIYADIKPNVNIGSTWLAYIQVDGKGLTTNNSVIGGGTSGIANATQTSTFGHGSLYVESSVIDTATGNANVAVNHTNVTLASFYFFADGEDIKIDNLNIAAVTTDSNGLAIPNGILNGKVYLSGISDNKPNLNSVQVGTTKNFNPTVASPTNFTFGSTFVVPAGATVAVRIIGDIKSTTSADFNGGEKIQITITPGLNNAQGMKSLYTFSTPSASVVSNHLTVINPSLTITKSTTFGDQTVAPGTNNVKLGEFIVSLNAAEGIDINSITVALNNPDTITNMYLVDNRATGLDMGGIKVTPTSNNIFNPVGLGLGSGSIVISLYANVKSSANTGTLQATILASGKGDSGDILNASSQALQIMTIAPIQ